MGSLVGILSTVILVSTLATLIFAVFAYIASRKRQTAFPKEKHSGEYAIPNVESSPTLPQEFLLRMHHVHGDEEGPLRTTEGQSDSPEQRDTSPAPAPAAPSGKPAFRSLTDKKREQQEQPGDTPSPEPKQKPDS